MWDERKKENVPAKAPTATLNPIPEKTVPVQTKDAAPRAGAALSPDVAVVGQGMTIKGQIQSKQDMYIDGDIQGTLELPGYRLTIGPNGKAEAGAKAREVIVMGAISGDVEATERISIREGGKLIGDIRTAGIVIEDGAYFKGMIDIIRKESDVAAAAH